MKTSSLSSWLQPEWKLLRPWRTVVIFVLSFCHAPEETYLLEVNFYTDRVLQFYVYCPDWVLPKRISLDLMGLVASWACVSGFHGTVKIRETVLDNTRALHTKQNETHSNLSVNEA